MNFGSSCYCALRRNSSVLRPKMALEEEQIVLLLTIKPIIYKQRVSLQRKNLTSRTHVQLLICNFQLKTTLH